MFGILLGLSVGVLGSGGAWAAPVATDPGTPDTKEIHVVRCAYVCTAVADSSVRWEVSLIPRMGKDRIRIQSKFGVYTVSEDRQLNDVFTRTATGAEVAETVMKAGDKHQFLVAPSMIDGQWEGKMTAVMDPTYEGLLEKPDQAEKIDFFCARRWIP